MGGRESRREGGRVVGERAGEYEGGRVGARESRREGG